MEQVKNKIGYIILAIAAIVVVVVVWFKAESAATPTTTETDTTSTVERETELPEFAYIEERKGERVLVNERDGYAIPLEENWVPEYYTNVVEVFVRDDYPSGELTASFDILKNKIVSTNVDEIIQNKLDKYNNDCPDCFRFEEKVKLDKYEVVVLKDYAAITPNYYLFTFVAGEYEYEMFGNNISKDLAFQIINDSVFN